MRSTTIYTTKIFTLIRQDDVETVHTFYYIVTSEPFIHIETAAYTTLTNIASTTAFRTSFITKMGSNFVDTTHTVYYVAVPTTAPAVATTSKNAVALLIVTVRIAHGPTSPLEFPVKNTAVC